ncbi:hypothetical protein B0H14DRAFT_1219701 [Mycena olivaceomarginata]|nr:hypothetical protein B0H14DRAFT_1219701 [Mycena olivaceomarginata]
MRLITTYDLQGYQGSKALIGGIPWGRTSRSSGLCLISSCRTSSTTSMRFRSSSSPLPPPPTRMNALLPSACMGTFIGTLHTILKPFLLRRMTADVLGAWFLSLCLLSFFLELGLGLRAGP